MQWKICILLCIFSICAVTLPGACDIGLCEGYTWDYVCRVRIGDNYGRYIGFRDLNNINQLEDDGVMNVVVKNWRNP